MPKQTAIPGLRDAMKKKVTRREQFLAEMHAVVPWGRLMALIAPHYTRTGPKGGRPPMPLETMLRVYFLQNWYVLSDPMAEETLYDSEAMRRFAGIELGDDRIPDRDHDPQLPAPAGAAWADRGDLRRRERAPGRQGHHAPLGHAGGCDDHRRAIVDQEQGQGPRPRDVVDQKGQRLVFRHESPHRRGCGQRRDPQPRDLDGQTARQPVWDALLHGEETSVWADKGYVSAEREAAFKAPGKVWGVMRKAPKGSDLHPIDARINRIIAMVRAKVEHPFRIIKRQFGHVKTRYRGLAKNRAQLFTLFALGNLFLVRRRLMA
jgi:transposase, IS5 family